MHPTHSAVIVPIPEAEPVVGVFRRTLDPASAWGVPAHVTAVHPFLPPDRIGADELERLGDAIRSVPRFSTTFAGVRWFDDAVFWLRPQPDAGFRALTDAVHRAFPSYPPYGGAFDDPIPHLTVGAIDDVAAMRAAARSVEEALPFGTGIGSAQLFQGSDAPNAWRSVAEFPLG